MSVDLTELKISGDEIMPMDFGGLMPSALGGATERYGRLGNRYSAMISTPAMRIEPDGRRWSARLFKARQVGAIVEIHQPDFKVGAPGSPLVAVDIAAGKVLQVSGLTPHYAVREGQWLNYIVDGQRYLDQATENSTANEAGQINITIQELIRVPLTTGDVIELARPCIEGWIDGDFSIARDVQRITSFSFTIVEKG